MLITIIALLLVSHPIIVLMIFAIYKTHLYLRHKKAGELRGMETVLVDGTHIAVESDDDEIVAAISAAVQTYLKR
jgi:hypothetical protein